jgi:uncharacterized protein (TIGR00369 family)
VSSQRASKAALQKLLARAQFVRGYGLKLVSVSDAEATIAMPFRRSLERPGGTVNGPAFMAAADCAMWIIIKRHIGIQHDAVTLELNTAFLNAARRQTVYCTARILKLGKRIIYGLAECHDRRGKIFTHHAVTYSRI